MNTLTQKMTGSILMLAMVFTATPALAVEEGYGGGGTDPVTCSMIAAPDTIEAGGGTTLSWTVSTNTISAVLKGKNSNSWIQNVDLDGSWYISGILDTRSYTLLVTGPEGQKGECHATVTVEESEGGGDEELPTCELTATPKTILPNGATALSWDVSDNVVSAVLHPKGSNAWEQSVALEGSWYISGIIGTRTYSLTVENSNGDEYTCDAKVVVRSPETGNSGEGDIPSCEITATPQVIEVNGATTLVWEGSENVVSARLTPTGSDYVIANVTPSGSWYLSGITNTRSYSLTVRTATGARYTCDAVVTVVEELPPLEVEIDTESDDTETVEVIVETELPGDDLIEDPEVTVDEEDPTDSDEPVELETEDEPAI